MLRLCLNRIFFAKIILIIIHEGTPIKAFTTGHCYSFQGSQYRTRCCTILATDMIYFRYRSIPVYCFRFTAILYILYMYIYTHPHKCIHIDKLTQRYTNTPSVFVIEQNFSIYYLIILKLFIRKLLLHTQY